VIFGCFFQFLALIYALKDHFFKDFYENVLNLKREYLFLKNFMVLLWPTMLASVLILLNLIFGIFIASKDVGGVSILYYSERIYYLPYTLIGISVGLVLLPIISAEKILSDLKAIKLVQEKAYRYSILFIFPITLTLIFFSEDIITLFFYRGVFDQSSVTKSSLALILYLIGLPAAVIIKMLIPYLYAARKPKIVLKTIAISTFFCVILTIILFPLIGFFGVPLALSLSSWVNLFLLIKVHKKLNSFMLNPFLMKYSFKSIFFSLFLFCFLTLIDVNLSYFILSDIYKNIIELFFILALSIIFLYKMELEIYRKIINLLRNF